jgi:anoctamin-1
LCRLFYRWLKTLKVRTALVRWPTVPVAYAQRVDDFTLIEWGPQGLFPEYLEMGMVDTTFLVSLL